MDHCGEQLSVLVIKYSAEKLKKIRRFQNRVPKCCLAGIPGRGDTMIRQMVFPGQGSSPALRVCWPLRFPPMRETQLHNLLFCDSCRNNLKSGTLLLKQKVVLCTARDRCAIENKNMPLMPIIFLSSTWTIEVVLAKEVRQTCDRQYSRKTNFQGPSMRKI